MVFAMDVGWPTREHEAPIAIAAFDLAAFIDLEPDARMTERRAAGDFACAIASDPAGADDRRFGGIAHCPRR